MSNRGVIVVSGAGGFIGGHLVRRFREGGGGGAREIRAVDVKPLDQWYQVFPDVRNFAGPGTPDRPGGDCRDFRVCRAVCRGADEVYQFAADMGGMGFVENNKALCMLSVVTNTQMLLAAQEAGVSRFFFPSSTCVYNAQKQADPRGTALKEEDAYPALPEDGYGWEKLFSERMGRHFREDFGLQTRTARLHNVYGPHGAWEGGREKAPAAICRKVAAAVVTGRHEIEIWGDGEQTRSFMYIDDCVEGVERIARSEIREPINLGSATLVSINALVSAVERVAGVRLTRRYKPDAPRGVAGRTSDNTKIKALLEWEPATTLMDGIEKTYRWVYDEFTAKYTPATAHRSGVSIYTTGAPAIPGSGSVEKSRRSESWRQAIPACHGPPTPPPTPDAEPDRDNVGARPVVEPRREADDRGQAPPPRGVAVPD